MSDQTPPQTKPLKLNLGCGRFILDGYVNVDRVALPGVDVVHDLNKLPLPWPDNSVDEILADDVLEHIERFMEIMADIHRILRPGGRLRAHLPHFTSSNNAANPTHLRQFSVKTMNYFCADSFEGRCHGHYTDFKFARITSRRIIFPTQGIFFFNRPMQWLVNSSYQMQCFYEATGWSRLFPAQDLEVVLVK